MFISIDIGGTNTRVASSQNLKDIVATETFPSQKTLDDEKTRLAQALQKLSNGNTLSAIAFGVAGIVDKETCFIEQSPNYKVINQINVKDLLGEAAKNVTIYCGNDSEIACLGEAVLGAGAKFKSVAYLSLGTGVGGAMIENGHVSNPPKLFEPGHQIVDVSSSLSDGFGVKGSLETFISGESFKKRYNVQPHECKDEKIWFEYGRNVGLGVHNMTMLWSPDCIVIGGGMSKYFDNFISGVNDFLQGSNFIKLPKILKAEFGQGSGIVGGFVLISQATGYNL
jgi:glucokinase